MSVLNLYLKKFTLVILALQILNLSIYNTDFYDFSYLSARQQEEFNPVDSLAELLVESVEGFQDTFPESNHAKGKQSSEAKSNMSFKMHHLVFFAVLPERPQYAPEPESVPGSAIPEHYSYLFYKEINHPPSLAI